MSNIYYFDNSLTFNILSVTQSQKVGCVLKVMFSMQMSGVGGMTVPIPTNHNQHNHFINPMDPHWTCWAEKNREKCSFRRLMLLHSKNFHFSAWTLVRTLESPMISVTKILLVECGGDISWLEVWPAWFPELARLLWTGSKFFSKQVQLIFFFCGFNHNSFYLSFRSMEVENRSVYSTPFVIWWKRVVWRVYGVATASTSSKSPQNLRSNSRPTTSLSASFVMMRIVN